METIDSGKKKKYIGLTRIQPCFQTLGALGESDNTYTGLQNGT